MKLIYDNNEIVILDYEENSTYYVIKIGKVTLELKKSYFNNLYNLTGSYEKALGAYKIIGYSLGNYELDFNRLLELCGYLLEHNVVIEKDHQYYYYFNEELNGSTCDKNEVYNIMYNELFKKGVLIPMTSKYKESTIYTTEGLIKYGLTW